MKRIYVFLTMLFLLTISVFGEVDINQTVSEIKKDFEEINSKGNFKVEHTFGAGNYTTYNFIQNDNVKLMTLGTYENNVETYEKYYLKDDKIQMILTEKIKYSFDNKNTIKIEKEEHKYYFDTNQKLIRYIAPDNKTYDEDKIPNDIVVKSEILRKKMKNHLKSNNSKDSMAEEMKKEFEKTNKEIDKKFYEMKKEMDDFFKKF